MITHRRFSNFFHNIFIFKSIRSTPTDPNKFLAYQMLFHDCAVSFARGSRSRIVICTVSHYGSIFLQIRWERMCFLEELEAKFNKTEMGRNRAGSSNAHFRKNVLVLLPEIICCPIRQRQAHSWHHQKHQQGRTWTALQLDKANTE